MENLEAKVRAAVREFWKTRDKQSLQQGAGSGVRDTGSRTAVTGGAQMNGFANLICELLTSSGFPEVSIFCKRRVELPGFFRAEKKWDLLAVADGELIATVELKSQVGPSFGNNYNNRTEEAIGNATDLWTAYREGAFKPSQRPWAGYLFLLEETERSVAPVAIKEPHFKVFDEFRDASYAKRYEILLTKLVRGRLYDSACLLLSKRTARSTGAYREPSVEIGIETFFTSLIAKALSHAKRNQ